MAGGWQTGKTYDITIRAVYNAGYQTFTVGGLGINEMHVKSYKEIKTLPTTPGSLIEFNGCLFTLTGFKTWAGTPIWWPITGEDETDAAAVEYYPKNFGDDWTLKFDAGA
jgi:hypothetical protein